MSYLIRHNPFRELQTMQSTMNRLFDETWRSMDDSVSNSILAVDVTETAESYKLTANLPGVNTEDIDVTLNDGVLTISGEIKYENADEGEREVVRERYYGSFSRSMRLPKAVDSDNVNADYTNGVLTLTLPKSPDAQPRQIPIHQREALASNN